MAARLLERGDSTPFSFVSRWATTGLPCPPGEREGTQSSPPPRLWFEMLWSREGPAEGEGGRKGPRREKRGEAVCPRALGAGRGLPASRGRSSASGRLHGLGHGSVTRRARPLLSAARSPANREAGRGDAGPRDCPPRSWSLNPQHQQTKPPGRWLPPSRPRSARVVPGDATAWSRGVRTPAAHTGPSSCSNDANGSGLCTAARLAGRARAPVRGSPQQPVSRGARGSAGPTEEPGRGPLGGTAARGPSTAGDSHRASLVKRCLL